MADEARRGSEAEQEVGKRGGRALLDRPAATQPQHRRRERRANVHARHPSDQHVGPRHRPRRDRGAAPFPASCGGSPGDRPGEPEARDPPNPLTRPRREHASLCLRLAEPAPRFDEAALRGDRLACGLVARSR